MSQVTEEVTRTIENANADSLPAQVNNSIAVPEGENPPKSPDSETEEDFLALASNKVELDLEDAPFLSDESEAAEEANAAAKTNKEEKLEDEETEEKGSFFSRHKKLILIGAGVVLLLLVGLGALIISSFLEDDAIVQNVIVVPGSDVRQAPVAHQVKLEPFVVQCTDATGKIHFLQATFVLSTSDNAVFHEISNNTKVIRDAIYYFFEIQSVEVLLDTTNQRKIKADLLEAVNEYIVSGSLDDLYIDSYIIK